MKQCTKCNKEFKTKQELDRHLNRKIKCDNKIECQYCKKEFKTKQKLERHLDRKISCQAEISQNKIENVGLKNDIDKLKLENEINIINLKNEIAKLKDTNKIEIVKLKDTNKIEILKLQNDILKLKLEKYNEIKILKVENEKLKEIINKDIYLNGIIYKIEHKDNNKICYIGSTTKSIKSRYSAHKHKYGRWLLNDDYGKCEIYEYFKMYDIENFNITVLGEYKVINKKHLLVYEQLWMNKLKNINLNKAFTPVNIKKHLSKCDYFKDNTCI
jgi:DNA-directed RNA polymerase subunit RPC12/RpoP